MHMHTCMHSCIHEVQRCLYRYKSYTDTDNIHIHIYIHMQYATCHMPYATCNMQHTIQIQIHIHSCVCMYTKSHTHILWYVSISQVHILRFSCWEARARPCQRDIVPISIRMPNGKKILVAKVWKLRQCWCRGFRCCLGPLLWTYLREIGRWIDS
jgi:hypothetical protein